MSWTEITLEVSGESAEAITNFLFELGSSGVLEEGEGARVRLKAYFDGEPPVDEVMRYAAEIGAAVSREESSVREIESEDWANSWRDHFTPLSIGKRFFVCPPWTNERPRDRHAIVMDPGMAFGTGHHATTRMCLELCEGFVESRPVQTAVDLGSGSGILAIGLAKLGVPNVCAVEVDPIAREVAGENYSVNSVVDAITVEASIEAVSAPSDLLVANLFANLLVEYAPTMAGLLKPGGALVCSGFIDSDADRVEEALRAAGLLPRERRTEERWVSLLLERN